MLGLCERPDSPWQIDENGYDDHYILQPASVPSPSDRQERPLPCEPGVYITCLGPEEGGDYQVGESPADSCRKVAFASDGLACKMHYRL